eukprot:COSAG01_NODE_654_length_14482_cov_20.826347_4_plen_73_part_00
MQCTWAAARQAMIRVRYFLDGDDGAMDPAGGGWRPVKRQAHDGVALLCDDGPPPPPPRWLLAAGWLHGWLAN